MIKIGDNVRFLNAVGGGRVVRIDKGKGLIFVEDAEGFEIPVLERECVFVGEVNPSTNFVKKDFTASHNSNVTAQANALLQHAQAEPKVRVPETFDWVETNYGDKLNVQLAFFAIDIKQLQTSNYECYLVNDSNYLLFYNIVVGEPKQRKSFAFGTIEPNMQEALGDIKKESLNDWENVRVQAIALKTDKHYDTQKTIDSEIKINVVKFYKLHSFAENDYFDEPCFLIDVLAEAEREKLNNIDAKALKAAMFEKESATQPRVKKLNKTQMRNDVVEVDLHIAELIDNTAGLNNADMLALQMERFHAVIDENKNKKGQKIVFIHGKGEGVLRNEILKQLKTRYKTFYHQDASFREYGFGATMVTVR